MPVLTRSALSASPLADLHLIAGELGLDGYRRLRKAELVDRILGCADTADADPSDRLTVEETDESADTDPSDRLTVEETDESADTDPADRLTVEETDQSVSSGDRDSEASARATRSRRGRRRRRDSDDADTSSEETPVVEDADAVAAADAESAEDERADEEPAKRERAPRDRAPRDRGPKADAPDAADRTIEGVVMLQSGGSGLIKAEDGGADVYVSAAQVRRCELVDGDRVSGPVRPARRSERHPSLTRVEQINGRSADEVSEGTPYDALDCEFPTQRIALTDPALKAVADAAPFGRGSRVTITGSAMSGKTEMLRAIASSVVTADDVEVLTVLAGSRPEETGGWKTAEIDLHATVALPAAPEARARAVEGAIDAGRRMAARGQDVVVLIDTLDGLDRGVVRRALGAARNLTEGGSLTVIGTAGAPVGGETTVIALDRAQAAAGQYPALDAQASGTIKAELLS